MRSQAEKESDSEAGSRSEKILREVFRSAYPDAVLDFAAVAGGFVVALIAPAFGSPNFSKADAAQKVVEGFWSRNARAEQADRVVIFELDFFADQLAIFSEQAHLRARATSYEEGHPVFTTTSQDAFVFVNKVDAEALLIDPLSKQSCRVIEDSQFPGFSLGLRRFAQMDLGGSSFPVREVIPEESQRYWRVHFT